MNALYTLLDTIPVKTQVELTINAQGKAYLAGQDSYLAGLPREACPYQDPDLASYWRDGYEVARYEEEQAS